MNNLANLVGYQVVWFCAVIGASRGMAWPAIAAMSVFVAWQLAVSTHRRADVQLVLAAAALGIVIDGAIAASGLATYAAPAPAIPTGGAPVWIIALWCSFSLTLDRSLGFLRGRPLLAALLGAIGAALADAGAARGWNALTFATPTWHALAAIAFGWAIATPLLVALAQRWTQPMATPMHAEIAP